ncbi:MAG: hypothetical protein JWM76_204 [Pseudonocardiales bacterium]|nr:hypothetical protein [Pseudonocardiales bacterium]
MGEAAPTDRYTRIETMAERIDRNYAELLQELRVAETGVQILFAFLLGIAFQQRFANIDEFQRGVFVFTLVATATATVLFVTPVALHRFTFHQGRKDELVRATHRLAIAGLIVLMFAILGSILLVLDWVVNRPFALTFTAVFGLGIVALWFILPRRHNRSTEPSNRGSQ